MSRSAALTLQTRAGHPTRRGRTWCIWVTRPLLVLRSSLGGRGLECIKPVVGGDSCQLTHLGVVQSGTMRITHEDGTEVEIGPGDTYVIEPGHQAEVVSDEPFVGFEFQSQTAEQYARQ